MKKFLAACAAFLCLAAAHADEPVAPDLVVKRTTAQLQDLIATNLKAYRADLPGFYQVVDDVVVPHFDVPFIARIVLARHWKGATDAQKQRFQVAFKNMLIRSYANALLEYHDAIKAEWKPLHMAADTDDVTVMSNLLREGKQPISIGFAMHRVDGAWKIYDITVENISLATNFRGQLSAEIKRTSLESVIERMETGTFSTTRPKADTTAGMALAL